MTSPRWSLLPMVTVLCAGCHRRPVEPPAVPAVEFVGCLTVTRGPVCNLTPKRQLTLWWPQAEGAVTALATDRGAVARLGEGERGGGRFVRVAIPAGARRLDLALAAGASWRLALGEPLTFEYVDRAMPLIQEGRHDQAIAVLEAELPALAGADRWIALGQVARRHLALGRLDRAAELLVQTIPGLARAGEASLSVLDTLTLGYVLIERQQRYREGREMLARAAALLTEVPALAASLLLLEGRAALFTGDLRAAVDAFQKAYQRASRLGMEMDTRRARRYLVTALRYLGREREAIDIQRALVADPSPDGCERSADLVTLAITLAEQARAEPPGGGDPGAEAETLFAGSEAALGGCSEPGHARNIAVERLLLSIERGRLDEARARWRTLAARTDPPSPMLQVWELEAAGRLALLERRSNAAAAAFAAQQALAERLGLEEEQLRALVALGEAREGQGRRAEAIAAYRRAESFLEDQMGRVPLGEGLFGFARSHRRSAEQLVDALLRLGSPAEALEAARLAQARASVQASQAHRIARLGGERQRRWQEVAARYQRLRAEVEAERADWRSTAGSRRQRGAGDERIARARAALDEAFRTINEVAPAGPVRLRAPAPGELFLVFARARGGWLGFAAGASVDAVRLGPIDPGEGADALAHHLLEPFARQIAGARRIRLLAPEALWRRDLHALVLGGRPLLAHAPVSFGLDVPESCTGCRPVGTAAAGTALLVSDPGLDLRGARQEAGDVAAALTAARYQVQALAGLAATHASVLPLLGQVGLFHYAGHARPGPREGLDGVLPLAGGTSLLVADVLALDRVPGRVVLSACESALVPEADGGLSLAHAFVLGGARAVIASTRPVNDSVARSLVMSLYQHGFLDPTADPAEALRLAQLAAAARASSDDDWAAFRVLIP